MVLRHWQRNFELAPDADSASVSLSSSSPTWTRMLLLFLCDRGGGVWRRNRDEDSMGASAWDTSWLAPEMPNMQTLREEADEDSTPRDWF